jgi:hypothetical protein
MSRSGKNSVRTIKPVIDTIQNLAIFRFCISAGVRTACVFSGRPATAKEVFALPFLFKLARYDIPVPGMPAVNDPRLFHVRPRLPIDVLNPDLLMFIRMPGAIRIDFLNRKPMSFAS